MSLSFEESLKSNNMVTTNIVAEDASVATPFIMTLENSGGTVAYSGDGGNWTLHSDYVYYSTFYDDNISNISDEKDISLNRKQVNITQEENSQYIPFEMSRYYDGYDLTKASISIHYETKNGRHGASKAINVTYNNEKIRFGWLVDAGATIDAGTLKFEIHAYGTVIGSDGTPLGYVWKTKCNENLNVLQSLCDCEDVINNIDDSWVQELVTDITEKIAEEIKDVIYGEQVKADIEILKTNVSNLQSADVDLQSQLNTKVDKVDGKGLSTNDYDDTAKEKVTKIGNTNLIPSDSRTIVQWIQNVYDSVFTSSADNTCLADRITAEVESRQSADKNLQIQLNALTAQIEKLENASSDGITTTPVIDWDVSRNWSSTLDTNRGVVTTTSEGGLQIVYTGTYSVRVVNSWDNDLSGFDGIMFDIKADSTNAGDILIELGTSENSTMYSTSYFTPTIETSTIDIPLNSTDYTQISLRVSSAANITIGDIYGYTKSSASGITVDVATVEEVKEALNI